MYRYAFNVRLVAGSGIHQLQLPLRTGARNRSRYGLVTKGYNVLVQHREQVHTFVESAGMYIQNVAFTSRWTEGM